MGSNLLAVLISVILGLNSVMTIIDTKHYEGLRLWVYKDSKGYKTIGYGHNLLGGSDTNLVKAGLDKQALLRSKVWPASTLKGVPVITLDQAEELYKYDRNDVAEWIKKLVPSFDNQPAVVQDILIDMGFNMGQGTLSQFKRSLKAINTKQYKLASQYLKQSDWYYQVGDRSKNICSILSNL